MRVFLSNLGCKLNQAETERLARDFAAAGHTVVGKLERADLHVINSCTVTHVAARDSRKIARRGKRVNPDIKTVLTGCFVNGSPEEAARLAAVDLLVPNERKDALVADVTRIFGSLAAQGVAPVPDLPYLPLDVTNARCLVKIEDGCNMPCAFCIIPATRGVQRSRPTPEIVGEVRELVAAGHKEIVLTGVQISSYRWQGRKLYDLTESLLEETDVHRLRLTSIAPWQFDERLLDLFDSGRLCRHFHLSLQSGCNETLARMRRPYTTSRFESVVGLIRDRLPDAAITTDVIVGFPGETDEEFSKSLEFVEQVGFAKVHAFPFSSRPGTAAESMPHQIPHAIKRQRMSAMLEVAERAEGDFWSRQLGHQAEILWERDRNGHWLGMTDNYIRVVSGRPQRTNEIGRGTLVRSLGFGVEVSMRSDQSSQAG